MRDEHVDFVAVDVSTDQSSLHHQMPNVLLFHSPNTTLSQKSQLAHLNALMRLNLNDTIYAVYS